MTGLGTQISPYIITSPDDLNNVRNNLTAYYELGSDIDMTGYGNFTPIGNNTTPFLGHFDGKGFKIINLTISTTTTMTGLFGKYGNGAQPYRTIQNVTLENPYVKCTGNASSTGALIGYGYGCDIINCHVIGGYIEGYTYTGGLIGNHQNGAITNCSVKDAEIKGRSTETGGFIGYNNSGSLYTTSFVKNCTITGAGNVGGFIGKSNGMYGKINKCYAEATITTTGSVTGGFAGYLNEAIVNECYSNCNITATGSYAAGFIGFLTRSSSSTRNVANCYCLGTMSTLPSNGGGFVGYHSNATIASSYTAMSITGTNGGKGFSGYVIAASCSSCYFDSTLLKTTSPGVTGATHKTTAQMQTQATFSGFDFTTTWYMNGYPALQAFMTLTEGSSTLSTTENVIVMTPGSDTLPMNENIVAVTPGSSLLPMNENIIQPNTGISTLPMNERITVSSSATLPINEKAIVQSTNTLPLIDRPVDAGTLSLIQREKIVSPTYTDTFDSVTGMTLTNSAQRKTMAIMGGTFSTLKNLFGATNLYGFYQGDPNNVISITGKTYLYIENVQYDPGTSGDRTIIISVNDVEVARKVFSNISAGLKTVTFNLPLYLKSTDVVKVTIPETISKNSAMQPAMAAFGYEIASSNTDPAGIISTSKTIARNHRLIGISVIGRLNGELYIEENNNPNVWIPISNNGWITISQEATSIRYRVYQSGTAPSIIDDVYIRTTDIGGPGDAFLVMRDRVLTLGSPSTVYLRENITIRQGDPLKPYPITNRAGLERMQDFPADHYIIMNDIDISEAAWTKNIVFTGLLDGAAHTITGLHGGNPLISVNKGTIKNLTMDNTNITQPSSDGATYRAGAIAGINQGLIEKCGVNGGTLTSAGIAYTTQGRIGGIVGENTTTGIIRNCYTNLTVRNIYAAGIASVNDGTIEKCYVVGLLDAFIYPANGGICRSGTGTVTSSYYNTETTGATWSDGGSARTTAQMKQMATYIGWDFTDIWNINEGLTYPYFIDYYYPGVATLSIDETIKAAGTLNLTANERVTISTSANLPLNEKIIVAEYLPVNERVVISDSNALPMNQRVLHVSSNVLPLNERVTIDGYNLLPLTERTMSAESPTIEAVERVIATGTASLPIHISPVDKYVGTRILPMNVTIKAPESYSIISNERVVIKAQNSVSINERVMTTGYALLPINEKIYLSTSNTLPSNERVLTRETQSLTLIERPVHADISLLSINESIKAPRSAAIAMGERILIEGHSSLVSKETVKSLGTATLTITELATNPYMKLGVHENVLAVGTAPLKSFEYVSETESLDLLVRRTLVDRLTGKK